MSLDQRLLEVLACPEDKGPLWYFEDEEILYNPRLRRVFVIDNGIPVLLIDESKQVSDDEHQRLASKNEKDKSS
ncbi:MAG: protein YcaR in KDO2-Lipid A biosynthesis cluster [Acidimicrobiaceae bacterium]|nr:protein YcaR in KDO2-Lipid A biosynthesis cluster [Acidimicrobiaceae bacterium]|tara:strand:- start:112 stop:333 length:222 start_codon:yes stop_codon:yes gene_type:complete